MIRTAARSDSSEAEPRAGGQRNQFGGPEAQESNEWLKTVLEICTQLETPELRRKFSGLINSSCEEKHQLLNEKKKLEDELAKERQAKSLKQEVRCQRLQNTELKEDFGATPQCRDANTRKHGAAHRRERMPQKRQRAQQSSDDEYEDSNPRERVRGANLGVSREQIRDVLGGSDRGWGSMQSYHETYQNHAILDIRAHLFGRIPSHRQNVDEGVFGFWFDNDVISGAVVFPLFVRGISKHRLGYTYLGNYVAIRLDPVAWERLSREGKESAVTTVQSKGFSRDPCLHRMEKTMKHETIRDKFHRGDFKVPCSRLEFRSFDEELNTAVQDSPGRR